MEFVWDPAKSVENQKKHGVSFEEATSLWGRQHVEVKHIAHAGKGESRSASMGWIGRKIYVAIWTQRGGNIRLISVRRARKNEEKVFFEKIQNGR